jgi:hypothetical protein
VSEHSVFGQFRKMSATTSGSTLIVSGRLKGFATQALDPPVAILIRQ